MWRSRNVRETRGIARYQAIAATSNAILALLKDAAAGYEWSESGVEILQAGGLQSPVENQKSKISIYLYRVVRSSVRRDRGPRVGWDGVTYRPSIPIDLHYLVTAWSSDAQAAHQLLGWTIRTLHDTPVIPAAVLNTHQDGPDVFDADENVELSWEPLSVGDLSDLWQVSPHCQTPSATYIARGVSIESLVPVDAGAPVTVRQFDYSKAPA